MPTTRMRSCSSATMAMTPNHSMNQVFIRTINTTLTSFIPVFAMLLFGGETLKDFAFAMAIGLIAGSYSSIAIACPLYCMWKTREPSTRVMVTPSSVGGQKLGAEPSRTIESPCNSELVDDEVIAAEAYADFQEAAKDLYDFA